jgi:hypothetical protein
MRFRKLRIAWSVLWGVVALLLCVLWVRSYWRIDVLHSPSTRNAWEIWSFNGRLIADWGFMGGGNGKLQWTVETPVSAPVDSSRPMLGFAFRSGYISHAKSIPLWFVALLSGAIAGVPWLNWSTRFSLRTLLFATTLIAVALGFAVYSARK